MTITHDNREFTITDSVPMGENATRTNPNAKSLFVAEGKRGAQIMGILFNDGTYRVTGPMI